MTSCVPARIVGLGSRRINRPPRCRLVDYEQRLIATVIDDPGSAARKRVMIFHRRPSLLDSRPPDSDHPSGSLLLINPTKAPRHKSPTKPQPEQVRVPSLPRQLCDAARVCPCLSLFTIARRLYTPERNRQFLQISPHGSLIF